MTELTGSTAALFAAVALNNDRDALLRRVSALEHRLELLGREPENELTIQMLISAGFVSETQVAQARKIALDLIAKQHSE